MKRYEMQMFHDGRSPKSKNAMTVKTTSVMHSCMILSCVTVNVSEPMRFAGTWNVYSGSAMSQLIRIINSSGLAFSFRCPYHARVMKIFEITSKITVIIGHSIHSAASPYTEKAERRRSGAAGSGSDVGADAVSGRQQRFDKV
jgi:hypothetical protein